MIGTYVNVGGIVAGSLVGLIRRKPLSVAQESWFKVALGALTVFYGLQLCWLSFTGPFLQILKQLLIAILALAAGRLLGRLLRLQKLSNRAGHRARELLANPGSSGAARASNGFKTCAILFCAAPLGLLGALQDGLSGYYYPLALKAVIEGLAAIGFVTIFGWGVLLAALPVLALQGSITLFAGRVLHPFLETHSLVDSVNLVGGLLVFSVALIILELKKIEVTDYLPALAMAPLLTVLLR